MSRKFATLTITPRPRNLPTARYEIMYATLLEVIILFSTNINEYSPHDDPPLDANTQRRFASSPIGLSSSRHHSVPLGSIRLHSAPLGFIQLHSAPLDSTRFNSAAFGSTRHHSAPPHFVPQQESTTELYPF